MNVFNVFRINGMPDDEEGQNKVVEQVFEVRNMHVHSPDGEYFVVRCTRINEPEGIQVDKLDPKDDAELMQELVELYLDNSPEKLQ